MFRLWIIDYGFLKSAAKIVQKNEATKKVTSQIVGIPQFLLIVAQIIPCVLRKTTHLAD